MTSMDDESRSHLIDLYDAKPASVEQFRSVLRQLIGHLDMTSEEMEIVDWDARGRDPAEFSRLAELAWDFNEVGDAASRQRLFAGFVTNGDITDGYGADYIIDYALCSGIPTAAIYDAMTSYLE